MKEEIDQPEEEPFQHENPFYLYISVTHLQRFGKFSFAEDFKFPASTLIN